MSHPAKKDTRMLEVLTNRCVKGASSPWTLEAVLLFLALWLCAGLIAIQKLSERYETVATKLLKDDAVSTESIVSHEIVVAEEEKKSVE